MTLRYVYAQDMVYMSSYCMELTSGDLEVRVRPGHGVHVFLNACMELTSGDLEVRVRPGHGVHRPVATGGARGGSAPPEKN